ncbi:hypothetical protein ERO13_D04G140300v2 [Gossypium hirsutum]|uniref:Protein LAX PANICLE 2 isoform X1 n=1 Tax=Gossypium hirsutum TaxID=3635 RepID=A0ABM2ZVT1_GOSHI|nr:protein LAX PANICLE 2-like isoform X1 [Gossypium hirsutum]KAG4152738.1 hypothetical protein ERO13_D04G140300v2 [Gossypium hirsutum]
MTMVPAENLSKQNHLPHCGGLDFYGCGGGGGGDSSYTENFGLMNRLHGYDYHNEACLGSDLGANQMAENPSRTNSLNETGSSSKDYNQEQEERDDEGWLQLSIGGHATKYHDHHHHNKHDQVDLTATRGGLTELDLLPGGTSHQERPHMPEFRPPLHPLVMQGFTTSLFLQQQGTGSMFSRACRPIAAATAASPLVPLGSYFARPFQVQPGIDVAGPSTDFKIIDPPRRPHSGIWFILQASENQAKEPFLPQIPKSYLRIKDGKMTVGSIKKYLVNKLKLDSESEQVEIRCRGEELEPGLTLEHVRDQIWSSTDAVVTLLPHTSTPPSLHFNLMLLHYGRRA